MATRRIKLMKYQVNHAHTSGGPKFSSLTEACAYIAHCMRNGNSSMSIHAL